MGKLVGPGGTCASAWFAVASAISIPSAEVSRCCVIAIPLLVFDSETGLHLHQREISVKVRSGRKEISRTWKENRIEPGGVWPWKKARVTSAACWSDGAAGIGQRSRN